MPRMPPSPSFPVAAPAELPQPQLWREAGREPPLEDALSDPLVHLVMRRDGVTLAELVAVICRARVKLRRAPCCRRAA